MDETRIRFLKERLETNPDDAFARYGLALEFANSGELAEAWRHFEYLLDHHSEYAAAYYQAGMVLIKQGWFDQARKVLARGIEVTGRQGKLQAQRELQAALDDLANEG